MLIRINCTFQMMMVMTRPPSASVSSVESRARASLQLWTCIAASVDMHCCNCARASPHGNLCTFNVKFDQSTINLPDELECEILDVCGFQTVVPMPSL